MLQKTVNPGLATAAQNKGLNPAYQAQHTGTSLPAPANTGAGCASCCGPVDSAALWKVWPSWHESQPVTHSSC